MKGITLVLLAILAACGSLPDQGGGVVALEVLGSTNLTLNVGQSLTLRARALDIHGDSVAAPLFWRTADTTLVTLDTVSGVVIARTNTGTARVQARVGTLLSDLINITLHDSTSSIRGGP